LYHSLHGKGLELIAVNSNDDASTIKKYRTDSGFSFIMAMDNVGKKDYGVAGKYGVQAYPTNYVLNSSGKVVWRGVGFDEDAIRSALAKLGVK